MYNSAGEVGLTEVVVMVVVGGGGGRGGSLTRRAAGGQWDSRWRRRASQIEFESPAYTE